MTVNRIALVTGASRGLGRELAAQLFSRGFTVVGASRSVDEGGGNVIAGDGRPAQLLLRRCNVRQAWQVDELFEWVREQFGRLDVLVNNAGTGAFLSLDDTSDALWEETIETNLTGAFRCLKRAVPLMRAAGGGLIVNMASIAGERGFANLSAYCASKAGLLGLGRAAAEELRPQGIHVCNVLAGTIATSFWEHAGLASDWDRNAMMSPAKAAERIADAIAAYPDVVVEKLVLMPRTGVFE
jgi:NAD(P)-dependent dehydrogenase (short-subunit alcohol dehydrogenase family)